MIDSEPCFFGLMLLMSFSQISDHDKCVQMPSMSLAHLAQSKSLTWIQRLSSSENALFSPAPGLEAAAGGLLAASMDNFTVKTSKETAARGNRGRWV